MGSSLTLPSSSPFQPYELEDAVEQRGKSESFLQRPIQPRGESALLWSETHHLVPTSPFMFHLPEISRWRFEVPARCICTKVQTYRVLRSPMPRRIQWVLILDTSNPGPKM